MLARRLAQSLRQQDWTVVIIELLLVIFGVLIALQLNNWNSARINKNGVESSLIRLRGEVEANIAALDDRLAYLEASSETRQQGLNALANCEATPAGVSAVGGTINNLTGDIIPSFVDNSLRELARRDRYLDFLSDEFRKELNLYSARLFDEREQLAINFNLMWDEHVLNNPVVGFKRTETDIMDPTIVFTKPMSALCEDTIFHRQLFMTDVWHRSTSLRLERFKGWNEEFLAEINGELERF